MTVGIAATDAPRVRARWNSARIAGHAVMALWIACGLLVVWMLASGFDQDFFWRYFPRMLSGLWVTILLVAISISLGALLAFPLAFARLSRNRAVGALAYGYVYFFRGTPILAQTFLVYYGAGQFRPFFDDIGLWWFFRDAYYCVILTFTLNTAAYQAEILRGAIQSVPRGQIEAAASLGLRPAVTFWKVVMPQAMIVALRPFGNEIILMIKASAIASVVTIFDLMGATRLAFARSFDFDVYIWAALIYLAMVETLRHAWDAIERRLTRHLRPVASSK
jgi:polar amino acid transport system permease protein